MYLKHCGSIDSCGYRCPIGTCSEGKACQDGYCVTAVPCVDPDGEKGEKDIFTASTLTVNGVSKQDRDYFEVDTSSGEINFIYSVYEQYCVDTYTASKRKEYCPNDGMSSGGKCNCAPFCSTTGQPCGLDSCGFSSCGECPKDKICKLSYVNSFRVGKCEYECTKNSDCANNPNGRFCANGACNSVCVPDCAGKQCGDDNGCGVGNKCTNCPDDKVCDTAVKVCKPRFCEPTKTCAKDHKGQCGLFFDDGCTEYGLDCSNNCAKEKVNKYCDIVEGKCVNKSAVNCCVGVFTENENGDEKKCNSLQFEEYCFASAECFWDYREGICHNSFAQDVDEMIKSASPQCQSTKYIYISDYDDALAKTEDFFNGQNCKAPRIFVIKHGAKKDCGPLFEYVTGCAKCLSGKCNSLGVSVLSCSVF
ncbi:MAG: hypothetical protein AAB488_02810 [Patescibacteria group bacterium]